MIGTIEALGVFLLAVLPGFLILRVYGWGRPPLQHRGALGELGVTVVASGAAWVVLYTWRGQELLPVVLGDPQRPTSERLDAFAELAGLSILLAFALGALCKMLSSSATWVLRRALGSWTGPAWLRPTWGDRLTSALRRRTVADSAWDRLLVRLANRGEPVICRVTTKNGAVVLGVFANAAVADWEADGRGLLLEPEVIRDQSGQLRPLLGSRGVFVPGDEQEGGALTSRGDDKASEKRHSG